MLVSCIVLSSCVTTPHLVGNYAITNSIETNKSYDEVWGDVIDFFATSGIPISTMEKESGLIVSSKVALDGMTTTEENGKISNPNAYIVIPSVKSMPFVKSTVNVTADFNVRVKEQNGKVIVTVNLTNIMAQVKDKTLDGKPMSTKTIEAKSTGVFEKTILELFK